MAIIGFLVIMFTGLVLCVVGLGMLVTCAKLGAGASDGLASLLLMLVGAAAVWYAFSNSPFIVTVATQ